MKTVQFLGCLTITGMLFSCKPAGRELQLNDSNTPLHLMKPDYPIPYGVADTLVVKKQLKQVLQFLIESTPVKVVDTLTKKEITDYSLINKHALLERGKFRLTSYEWGVTYGAMLNAAKITADQDYNNYVSERFNFITQLASVYSKLFVDEKMREPQMIKVVHPEALDDAGAMCVAMIKAQSAGVKFDGIPSIKRYIDYIMQKEYRLPDGTFARNRPHHNTVWLDDMFMAIPAISQMGVLTGDKKYFKEAVRQIALFKDKMWVPEKGLYRHGWVEAMSEHPSFHWGRANGWAILTKVEVLDALPQEFPEREMVLEQFRAHVKGLAQYQSGDGFWHQLLDRNDSYEETSATAIYAYCIAKGVNEGWLDAMTYGPMAMLAWNAVSTKINDAGEVEGTCVGTGMGFDPAFYCYRPVHKYAAHGYGPVILAGSEIIRLIRLTHPKMNDSALHFYPEAQETEEAIFWTK